mmetsp:Transcript_15243/g.16924  ORF Transcript_15243/g.16924 Transcript_15243/m.16924 type:complete len:239 (-) Transcript_15243:163-879(-)
MSGEEIAKLYYYPATGRAHQIRLALAASGIVWDDVFGSFPPNQEQKEEWRSIGGNTTTNVPMLVMPNGKVYTQSHAVLKAVGRMGKLMPSGDDDLYLVDKLLADAEDIRTAAYKTFVTWGAPQSDVDAFLSPKGLELHLGNLERQLVSKYFIGDNLTIADISVYDAVTSFGLNRLTTAKREELLGKFPKLAAWIPLVESDNPKIASYLSSDDYEMEIMKFGPETLGFEEEETLGLEEE